MKARHAVLIGSVGLGTLGWLAPAHAQDDTEEGADESATSSDEGEAATEDEAGDEKSEADAEATDESDEKAGAEEEEKSEASGSASDSSPVEEAGKQYMFIGLRYRGIVVPAFMIHMFGEGGNSVYINSFGPEFVLRKDDFEFDFSLWYADYGMDPTAFKAKDDPIDAWEIVESKMKVLYITADFLWSTKFSPEFALNYGMGAGLGLVFGDLIREQATPPPGDPNADPDDWQPCAAPGAGQYCGDDNDHYDGYSEPSWANGGSKPMVFPWFALQTGLRYKPHKKFVARLDLGFGTSGFFFGLGADYGL